MSGSYSYRDSARSPGDRAWARDDPRDKDDRGDRGDSFYRRSPGPDRPRRRSRSPIVDRYEPRGRDRDDYVATRGDRVDRDRGDRLPPRDRGDRVDRGDRGDREDRARRPSPPPPNIDRYVPGQDAAPPQPFVNPLMDPFKMPYQVGFSYFGEWWRTNEKIKEEKERQRTGRRREPERVRNAREAQEEREKEKAKIQVAYDAYKEELQSKMAQTFVRQHKDEQWFRERYVPEIREPFKQVLNEIRRGGYSQWEQDLEAGTFDELSLEGIPKSETNGAGAVLEKEEGEAVNTNEVLGVGDLVPVNSAEIRDENLFQPTLLIKTIAPSVSRRNLEAFCKEHLGEGEGGYKWLSLSDPNPSKRYHRIGWILINPGPEPATQEDRMDIKDEDGEVGSEAGAPVSTAQKALEAINGKTVKDEQRGDFTCHVGVHNPPTNPRKKALWDLFSAPERIEKDLGLAKRLISKFEDDFGSDFNAILKIEERVEDMKNSGRLQPTTPAPVVKKEKKQRAVSMDVADEEGEEHEPMEEDDDDDEGAIDDEVDDEDLLVKKKQLDLMIEYLRRVFNFCFFCVFESDSIHELTRKCPGGHLRRPRSTLSTMGKAVARASAFGEPFPSKKRKEPEELEEGEAPQEGGDRKFRPSSKAEQQLQRAYNWVKTFEDKIMQILEPENVDVRKLGGKPIDDAVNEELLKYVKQEDEHKYRCKVPDCTKLFKEDHFWKKHVEKRHTEWLEKLKEEFELVNSYVMDPAHIVPSRSDSNSNGHFPPSNGSQPTGTPRGFNLSNYQSNMFNMANFPMAMFPPGMLPPMGAVPYGGDDRGAGPIRRGGGAMGGGDRRFNNNRTGPYDRRGGQNPRYGGPEGGMGGAGGMMGRGGGGGPRGGAPGAGGKWGDGAAGGAAMGPREAVLGRSLKSYEDLDQVSGGGGGELNY